MSVGCPELSIWFICSVWFIWLICNVVVHMYVSTCVFRDDHFRVTEVLVLFLS